MHGINLKDGKFDILWKDKVIIGGVRPLICLEDTNSYTPDFVKEYVINGEDILGKYIEKMVSGDDKKTQKIGKDFLIDNGFI
jgi:hypothetical protein